MSEFDELQEPAPINKREKLIEKFISHDLKRQAREAFNQQLQERKKRKRSIQTEDEQTQA